MLSYTNFDDDRLAFADPTRYQLYHSLVRPRHMFILIPTWTGFYPSSQPYYSDEATRSTIILRQP